MDCITPNEQQQTTKSIYELTRERNGEAFAFRLCKAMFLDTGTIPAGAAGVATCSTVYGGSQVLALRFDLIWPAIAQWCNELLLFPDCVDSNLMDCIHLFIT